MSVDLTKPVYIIVIPQRDGRLAIMGGSNNLAEVQMGALLAQNAVVMVAVPVEQLGASDV